MSCFLLNCCYTSSVQFLFPPRVIPTFLVEAVNSTITEPLFMEVKINGKFVKYINNNGKPTKQGLQMKERNMCLAFCHWTYEYTDRSLIVTDLQGMKY